MEDVDGVVVVAAEKECFGRLDFRLVISEKGASMSAGFFWSLRFTRRTSGKLEAVPVPGGSGLPYFGSVTGS